MAVKDPFLNITVAELYDNKLLGIIDLSAYPTGWNIVTPTLQVEIPGYPMASVPFVAQSLQVLNSNVLGITCDDDCLAPLPDGIYRFTYSIYPAQTYYVQKTWLRVEQLMEKLDSFFLTLELSCKTASSLQKKQLDEVELYVNGAISAANNCDTKSAMELYNKALSQINQLIKANG